MLRTIAQRAAGLAIAGLLLVSAASPAQEVQPGGLQKPPFYGVFLNVSGRLMEARSNTTVQTSTASLPRGQTFRFIDHLSGLNVVGTDLQITVYDRALRTMVPDVKLVAASYVVMYAIADTGTGLSTRGIAKPLHRWVLGVDVEIRVHPAAEDPDMVRLVPINPLGPGLYVLQVGRAVYDFRVGDDPLLSERHRHNLIAKTDGSLVIRPYAPEPATPAASRYWVQHIDPSTHQFCLGYLSLVGGRMRFSASPVIHPDGHGFDIPCNEIKEAKKNSLYASNRGAFHVKFRNLNYNFIPLPSDSVEIGEEPGGMSVERRPERGNPAPILAAVVQCQASGR